MTESSPATDRSSIQRDVLQTAEKLICGDREAVYDDAFDNFTKIALMWSSTLGAPVTPVDVAMCMIQVKLSRLTNTPEHRDSWVDIAGYAALGAYVASRMNDDPPAPNLTEGS